MASNLLLFALFSCLAFLTQATPEQDLRAAIVSPGSVTYILKSNIVLSANLPPLPHSKILKVESANLPGSPFKIDGQKKYLLFRSDTDAVVTLTLRKLNLTRSKDAAVNIGGEGSVLSVETVNFIGNERALNLFIVNANIVNSAFVGHTKSAIVTQSEEGLGDDVRLFMCRFLNNKAEKGVGGGAIFVGRYTSITADKCYFSQNSADYVGGAVRIRSGYGKITRSTFESNKARESGGALSVYNSGADVVDVTFQNNVAETMEGGAVRISADDEGANVSFRNVIFRDNKALTKKGGAFVLNGTSEATFCIRQFSGNSGAGAPSNGHVLGLDNSITTAPGAAIPLVTVEPGAALALNTQACSP